VIKYSIALAFEFVFPHRHNDSFSIVADSGQAEVTMGRDHTKVRKARR
jgi:hypothetical protein